MTSFRNFSQAFTAALFNRFPLLFFPFVSGRRVYVMRFPVAFMGYTETPGWYVVDSFVYSVSGRLEMGLQFESGSVEYYPFDALVITAVAKPDTVLPPRPQQQLSTFLR